MTVPLADLRTVRGNLASVPLMPAVDHSPLLGAEVIDQVLLIAVDTIEVGDRLRSVDPVWARALGKVMAKEGQKKAIEVCRLPGSSRWTLVEGAHRVAAARYAGIVYLRAEVVSADREERRLREISALLWQRGLDDPFDRASVIAELVSLKRANAGIAETARRDASVPVSKREINTEAALTSETISNLYGWSEEVGAQLGFSGRTIRNDLLIYRMLAPSLIEALRNARHPVARNATQLRALAKLEEGRQRRVVERLLNDPALRFADALAPALGKAAPDPAAKRLSAFIGSFSRMSLAERKGALAQLAPLLPKGYAIEGVAA